MTSYIFNSAGVFWLPTREMTDIQLNPIAGIVSNVFHAQLHITVRPYPQIKRL